MCALRICANHIGFVCEEAVVPWATGRAESVTSHRRRDMSKRIIISIAEYMDGVQLDGELYHTRP